MGAAAAASADAPENSKPSVGRMLQTAWKWVWDA